MEDVVFNALPWIFSVVGAVLVGAVFSLLFGATWAARRECKARTVAAPELKSFNNYLAQSANAGPHGDSIMVFSTDNKHLEEVAMQIADLAERASHGDRDAEKTLLFAQRYGYDPTQN